MVRKNKKEAELIVTSTPDGVMLTNAALLRENIESSKVCMNLNTYIYEVPTTHLRWFIKKDGTKVLQQQFEINTGTEIKYEWRDIKEEVEE